MYIYLHHYKPDANCVFYFYVVGISCVCNQRLEFELDFVLIVTVIICLLMPLFSTMLPSFH